VKSTRSLHLCFSLAALLFLLTSVSLAAFDFGLVINQYAGYGYEEGDIASVMLNKFEYKANILPRFSFLIGENGDFLLSGEITIWEDDGFHGVPELLGTEFTIRFGGSVFKAGRMHYADPLSFIADGLFDGVQFSHNTTVGIFSAGAWYTGLLYKETANITMTANDKAIYYKALDYGNFAGTYFAPRRLLLSVDWRHPSFAQMFSLKAAVTGQIDLSGADERLHSQYLTAKASIRVKRFLFEIGGSLQTAQTLQADDSQFTVAFAGNFGIFWTLPTNFPSRLSFSGHFAGGRVNDSIGVFIPVTTEAFGDIFMPKLSGLTILELGYAARLNRTVGANLSTSFFIRNDLETFNSYPVKGDSNGNFLGTEFFARLIWAPFSDLQFNFGSGVFSPSLGNVSDEKPQWRVELSVILAL